MGQTFPVEKEDLKHVLRQAAERPLSATRGRALELLLAHETAGVPEAEPAFRYLSGPAELP